MCDYNVIVERAKNPACVRYVPESLLTDINIMGIPHVLPTWAKYILVYV